MPYNPRDSQHVEAFINEVRRLLAYDKRAQEATEFLVGGTWKSVGDRSSYEYEFHTDGTVLITKDGEKDTVPFATDGDFIDYGGDCTGKCRVMQGFYRRLLRKPLPHCNDLMQMPHISMRYDFDERYLNKRFKMSQEDRYETSLLVYRDAFMVRTPSPMQHYSNVSIIKEFLDRALIHVMLMGRCQKTTELTDAEKRERHQRWLDSRRETMEYYNLVDDALEGDPSNYWNID